VGGNRIGGDSSSIKKFPCILPRDTINTRKVQSALHRQPRAGLWVEVGGGESLIQWAAKVCRGHAKTGKGGSRSNASQARA